MRRSCAALAALSLALPGAGVAQDVPPFDIARTAECVAENRVDESCIGRAAEACMDSDLGGSTPGMRYCLEQELVWWDRELNAVYGETRAFLGMQDADRGETAAPTATAMLEMQRAWIAYRDARCDFELSLWAGGTGGPGALLACLMYETGRQTIILQDAVGD